MWLEEQGAMLCVHTNYTRKVWFNFEYTVSSTYCTGHRSPPIVDVNRMLSGYHSNTIWDSRVSTANMWLL